MTAKLAPTIKKRILLVEPKHETFVRLILLLDEVVPQHYTMDWAATYRFGTSLLERNEYDVCLVGTQLGFHNGLEFVNSAHAVAPDIPCIMLQEEDMADALFEATGNQMWDCLQLHKLSPQILYRSLRDAVRNHHAMVSSARHREVARA
jgi:DNA-binding NtrC family response regulator